MEPFKLLQEHVKDPDAQLIVFAAYDAAWSAMKDDYPEDGPDRSQARHRLALAILSHITEDVHPLRLRGAALLAFRKSD
jgi:hypothetical protein